MVQSGQRSLVLARRFQWVLLASAVATGLGPPANGQDTKTTLVEPPTPLLPQQVGEWVRQPDASAAQTTPDPKADTILNEDGLKRDEHAVYRLGGSGPAVTVTARQFVDAT